MANPVKHMLPGSGVTITSTLDWRPSAEIGDESLVGSIVTRLASKGVPLSN